MPKEVKSAKEFSQYLDIPAVKEGDDKTNRPKNYFTNKLTVKHGKGGIIKFKLRTSRYLITLKTKDQKTYKKIMDAIPPSLEKIILNKKVQKKKRR